MDEIETQAWPDLLKSVSADFENKALGDVFHSDTRSCY